MTAIERLAAEMSKLPGPPVSVEDTQAALDDILEGRAEAGLEGRDSVALCDAMAYAASTEDELAMLLGYALAERAAESAIDRLLADFRLRLDPAWGREDVEGLLDGLLAGRGSSEAYGRAVLGMVARGEYDTPPGMVRAVDMFSLIATSEEPNTEPVRIVLAAALAERARERVELAPEAWRWFVAAPGGQAASGG